MICQSLVRGALAAAFLLSVHGLALSADSFPFDRELLLDATPMRPGKRMPILTVEENGTARLDLWCRTVPARVEISDMNIKIEPGPLPEDLPAMQSAGQCTPERVKADEEILAALSQVTAWRRQGEAIVLEGAMTLRFRASDH
ncbi:MAG TPA: hypothetical protein VFI98_14925 [Pseudolabrys sp.]|jgi:hypothetical protein|nr:hypothetical protein [Pseudolabrys sp.]